MRDPGSKGSSLEHDVARTGAPWRKTLCPVTQGCCGTGPFSLLPCCAPCCKFCPASLEEGRAAHLPDPSSSITIHRRWLLLTGCCFPFCSISKLVKLRTFTLNHMFSPWCVSEHVCVLECMHDRILPSD